ncbi:sugar ABC transporter permease [Mycetocola tolaasinivorans]|uniref:Sugar ABC transporter permease n=1 Tax=Mycetocola tolaasinivorans TaxID=76635 RepID=A0A3L7A384_9MICO|nr:sugar ABC transporter permease [Mycetocola tolaasinivorans]RLP74564.1 sugar ABC transporter permease [Mycetocola tolaasinivorans]
MLKRNRKVGFYLTLPAVLLMAAMTIIPVVSVLQRALSGNEAFGRLFTSPGFSQVMVNTALWTVLSVVGALVLGYFGAMILQSKYLRGVGLWRSLFLIPWIIPGVVGATIWKWNFSRDYGQINQVLLNMGVISSPIEWLSDPNLVLFALVIVQIWSTAPFVILLVSAALTGIPAERYEAARLDGANGFNLLRYITLPAVSATTALSALTLVTWALNAFTIIFVATKGGPAGSSTILPVLLYQAFQTGDESMVAVIALLQLVLSAIFATVYIRSMRNELEESAA